MSNVWIFGDSFSETHRYPSYIRDMLEKQNTKKYNLLNYAVGSSDMQSIIDRWILCLPKIKQNDIVIVNLTDSSRYRLSSFNNPTKIPKVNTDLSNEEYKLYEISNVFDSLNAGSSEMIKNGWFDRIENDRNGIFFEIQNDLIKSKFIEFVHLLQYEHQYKSYKQHYLDIVNSLYSITPTDKKFVWCWQNEYDSEFIYSKDKIKNLVFNGTWQTIGDLASDEQGKGDVHLSPAYDEMLASYFYKTFFN